MAAKLPRWPSQKLQGILVRAHWSLHVEIHRPRRVVSPLKAVTLVFDALTIVYAGEALYTPSGQMVQRTAAGEVQMIGPTLVLPTYRPAVRQGDFSKLFGRTYEITDIDNDGTLHLKQYTQVGV